MATGCVHFAAGNQVLSLIKHLGHKLIIAPVGPLARAERGEFSVCFPFAEYSFARRLSALIARLFRKSTDSFAKEVDSSSLKREKEKQTKLLSLIPFSIPVIEYRELSRAASDTIPRAASLSLSLSIFLLNGR